MLRSAEGDPSIFQTPMITKAQQADCEECESRLNRAVYAALPSVSFRFPFKPKEGLNALGEFRPRPAFRDP